MADLLPTLRDTSSAEEADPRVIGVEGEGADELLDALSSETTRRVLTSLHREPATPSEVAARVDTSLQNVQYHLGKLSNADLVEVVDTTYSEKGREMDVYAPADRPLVIVAGSEEETSGLRAAVSRLLGGLGALTVLSALVQLLFGDGFLGSAPTADGDGAGGAGGVDSGDGAGGDAGIASTPTPELQAETAEAADAAASTATGLPPGLLFFAGGLVVLLIVFGAWYVQQARA